MAAKKGQAEPLSDDVAALIVHVKNQRAGYKSVLTKKRNEARSLLLDAGNLDKVKCMLPAMADAWHRFEACHNGLIDLLTSQDDIADAEQYYIVELDTQEKTTERVNKWIETAIMQLAYDEIQDSASQVRTSSVRSRASSSSRSTRMRQLEALAKRKALEAKFSALEKQQVLIERRYRLEQEELKIKQEQELLHAKSEIEEARAVEDVYTEALGSEIGKCSKTGRSSLRKTILNPKVEELVPPVVCNTINKSDWVQTEVCEKEHSNVYDDFVPHNTSGVYPQNKRSDDIITHLISAQDKQTSFLERMVLQQEQNSLALTLPTPTVPTFNGDPLQYTAFVRAFDALIETKTNNDSSRIYYLVQFTSGEVQDLMKSCLVMSPAEGYKEARSLLTKRYGQGYKIASAYVDQVMQNAPIKSDDSSALQQYSVLLRCCLNTLSSMNCVNTIENPVSLKSIIDKLPYDMRKRWRSRADTISEYEDREIALEDIVMFIEREARTSAHPVFGDISGIKLADRKNTNANVKKAFVTRTDQTKTEDKSLLLVHPSSSGNSWTPHKCVCCDGTHSIENCVQFEQMNLPTLVQFTKSKGLCFNCLVPRHRASDCRRSIRCDVCHKKHSNLLHQDTVAQTQTEEVKEVRVGAIVDDNVCIGLPIVPVKVQGQNGEIFSIYAFLDQGSNTTLCTDKLKQQLGVKGRKSKFSLTTLGKICEEIEGDMINLHIVDYEEELGPIELSSVICRPSLPITKEDVPKQEDIDRWSYLQGIFVPDLDIEVGLLIGQDNAALVEPLEVRRSQDGGPYAVRTILGWTLNGPLGRLTQTPHCRVNVIKCDKLLSKQFQESCDHDFKDSLADVSKKMSQKDVKAMKIMDATVKLKDGHYKMELPLEDTSAHFPDNHTMAEHRLKMLERRLKKDECLHKRYTRFMEDLFIDRYAEEVETGAGVYADGMAWFLPHHPVTHPMKPDTVRVVFDCSARYQETPLNDRLLQGPDFNNTIGVLIRFPKERVAVIKAMFNQVNVSPHHQSLLQFLWWKNGNLDDDPKVSKMKVHIFGTTSSPSCCAYALRKTATDNEDDYDDITINKVLKNCYEDDCLVSEQDEATAMRLSKHHFCDASEDGCGAVAYVRMIDKEDRVSTMSRVKSSATPIKVISIPRLELTAATLSVCLDVLLQQELDYHVSTAVLKFIRKQDKRFHTYVANRIAVIYNGSGPGSTYICCKVVRSGTRLRGTSG